MSEHGPATKVLAVASGGGHWVQLLRVVPAFSAMEVVFVTVSDVYRAQVGDRRFYAIDDATRWNPGRLLTVAARLGAILRKERPDLVISTGAAPGYLALRMGKAFGARTIWIDSIANVDALSLSGQRVGRYADLWLTQWPHLAGSNGPYFAGTVL